MSAFTKTLLALFLLCITATGSEAQVIGNVIAITPGAVVERDGETQELLLKSPLMLHDTIKTDATGKVKVLFSDYSSILVAKNTTLSIKEFADAGSQSKFSGQLVQGLARIITGQLVEKNPAGFSFTTPEAYIGIRGTIITVYSAAGQTTVYVENTMSKEVLVNGISIEQGMKITVPAPNPAPEPISLEDVETINQETGLNGVDANAGAEQDAQVQELLAKDFNAPTDLDNSNLVINDIVNSLQVNSNMASVSGVLTADVFSAGTGGTYGFDLDLSSGAVTGAWMLGNAGSYNLTGAGNINGMIDLTGVVNGDPLGLGQLHNNLVNGSLHSSDYSAWDTGVYNDFGTASGTVTPK